jgi:hypothetical protein
MGERNEYSIPLCAMRVVPADVPRDDERKLAITKNGGMGMSARSTVMAVFELVARERQRTAAPLSDDFSVLEPGLDSLKLAIIAVIPR